jgi:hypothetical protein
METTFHMRFFYCINKKPHMETTFHMRFFYCINKKPRQGGTVLNLLTRVELNDKCFVNFSR